MSRLKVLWHIERGTTTRVTMMLTRSRTQQVRSALKNYVTEFTQRRKDSLYKFQKERQRQLVAYQKKTAERRRDQVEQPLISASMTRNWFLKDPILDWLNLYGELNGFLPDYDYPDHYREIFDFNNFILKKGNDFERVVIAEVRRRIGHDHVIQIGGGHQDSQSIQKWEDTKAAMARGVPVIYQGVLRDSERGTCGSPDLLVRADYLVDLINNPPEIADYSEQTPWDWYYVVVDIKFSTLNLAANGKTLLNGGSSPAYKGQIGVYNLALQHAQNYIPDRAFILGRGWSSRSEDCNNAFDKLGEVDFVAAPQIYKDVDTCLNWLRRLTLEGVYWSPIDSKNNNRPTVPELYPNMCFTEDVPWHAAKREIATQLQEITLLWKVGPAQRKMAHAHGIYRWPECTPDVLGFKSDGQIQSVLDHILARNSEETQVALGAINNDDQAWQTLSPDDFYVDFETVSNVNDDFSEFPLKKENDMIWMIGCGWHNPNGGWEFQNWTTDQLTLQEEKRILDAWINYMQQRVRRRPRVFHWSQAERILMKRASDRHLLKSPRGGEILLEVDWIDMCKIFMAEPIVVPGMLNFKLKEVARAFHQHHFISTSWDNSYVDGIGSMAAAWICDEVARKSGLTLNDIDAVTKIKDYNYVDVRVIFEIVAYLRKIQGK